MRPTPEWMKQAFAVYNARFFGGELPTPRFEVKKDCKVNGQDVWGYYDLKANFSYATRRITRVHDIGVICLSSKYSRAEEDVIGTLIHEMIHEYVYLVIGVYPVDKHGRQFQQIARQIESYGFDVTSNEIKSTDSLDNDGDDNVVRHDKVLCLLRKPNGKNYRYWCCICDKEQTNEAYLTASMLPGIKSVTFYECNSPKLSFFKSNPKKLTGFGAQTMLELINILSGYFNENPNIFDFRKLKKL